MREIDSTCRQDLFVKNKLCSSTQMFIKFKLLSGKRVYVFANLFVWASSGGKFAKCDGIWIFGNGFFDKPKSISIGSGYQFWQSQFSNIYSISTQNSYYIFTLYAIKNPLHRVPY